MTSAAAGGQGLTGSRDGLEARGVFVTGGGLNPTSTIQALALYIADTMKKNLANLFD